MTAPTVYPAAIAFDLTGARRARVMAIAESMGLKITHHVGGRRFLVWVDAPEAVYALGFRSGGVSDDDA